MRIDELYIILHGKEDLPMKAFEVPIIEIVVFGAEDVITTSGGINTPEDEF